MPRKEYHVVPHENGWAVKKNNASKSSVCTSTKSDAVSKAKELSKNSGSEMVVHGKNGKIQYSNSYGNDPCPPKDKK
jgi:uncharacterized protein YdaT